MSGIADIKEFSALDFSLIICIFLGAIAPGFLTLWLFKPLLVQSLDTIKILTFSLSLAMPLFALNTIVLMCSVAKNVNQNLKKYSLVGGVVAILSFYPALLITFFCNWVFGYFVLLLVMIEFIWLLAFSKNDKLKNL